MRRAGVIAAATLLLAAGIYLAVAVNADRGDRPPGSFSVPTELRR